MLTITIKAKELFDSSTSTFIYVKDQKIALEHSLVSISKWESKWKKPFLSKDAKTREETLDYIRCMTLTQNVDKNAYLALSSSDVKSINDYIADEMTATTFSKSNNRPSREVITSELIYYWMITLGIPLECQKWHLNRLLTLIRVCSIKNAPQKKMSKGEVMSRNRSLNEARRAAMGSKG